MRIDDPLSSTVVFRIWLINNFVVIVELLYSAIFSYSWIIGTLFYFLFALTSCLVGYFSYGGL